MLTLHHLVTSRSSRVIWLLEALGTEYELVTHLRGPDMRALPDLAEATPLGKAPAIVDGDLVLVESATILRYIAERYGNGRFMPPFALPEGKSRTSLQTSSSPGGGGTNGIRLEDKAGSE